MVRSVSSSLRGSQNAALNRLAQIESRISSRRQTRQEQKAEKELTFNLRHQLSPPVAQSPGSPMLLSAQSSNDQSFNGKLFLKKNTAVAMNNSNTAGSSLQGPDVFIRSRFKAADTPVSLAHWEAKSARLVSGVSLESDEEDMKKLLGDSPDSMDNSCSLPRRPSSIRMSDKVPLHFKSWSLYAFHSLYLLSYDIFTTFPIVSRYAFLTIFFFGRYIWLI